MKRQTKLEIGLWVSPPVEEITDERYREIREAGFTFVIGLLEMETGGDRAVERALDAAAANGLQYIVHDPGLKAMPLDERKRIRARIRQFASHPAYMGHLLKDEPSASQIAGLAALKEQYELAAPNGMAYVNLYPSHAAAELLGDAYPNYVERYLSLAKPDILTYDHYPFLTDNSIFKGDRETADYYYNLELMREASLRYEVPFWLFIQTLAFNGTHRDPVYAEIRWQVYTSLAFGVKGIQYFTYWTPPDSHETFGDAMIDRKGRRTRHYDEVKAVNEEIAALGPVLMRLRSVGVVASGESLPRLPPSSDGQGPVARLSGDPALMGCFVDEAGDYAYMLVNRSYEEDAEARLAIETDAPCNIEIWEDGETSTQALAAGSATLRIRLQPGQGKLLQFKGSGRPSSRDEETNV
ncbi:beta-galactosidase [Cohnella sp. GbtcB17]|uniref:beta-galactosidase n=1 Tax=Cohnella sp. GbtcB17 TaxID=2824762 RepID=UPI001C2F83A2|nr:beta-galactosidase [Cohnella sp. GbtcB17]